MTRKISLVTLVNENFFYPLHFVGSERVTGGMPTGTYNQCSGSMTCWCGSGSADPCLWLVDPGSDQDPALLVINKKTNFKKSFSAYDFLKVY